LQKKNKINIKNTLKSFLSCDFGSNLSQWIENDSNFQIKKFAYKLKQLCAILIDCKPEDFEDDDFKKVHRKLLQDVGMKMRELDENIWINALFSEYSAINPENRSYNGTVLDYIDCEYPNWIITDLRFLNEAKSIKDRGGIIVRVIRDDIKHDHKSETELEMINYDFLISNLSDIDSLYSDVCELMKKIGY
jgi:hypothetical protein